MVKASNFTLNKKQLHEGLVSLYLRLNGYFTAGFIVHSPIRNKNLTEIDFLAVRFPHSIEPERKVETAKELEAPNDRIDFLVCEVKGGKKKSPRFNRRLLRDPFALASAFRRAGLFPTQDVPKIVEKLIQKIQPNKLAGADIPKVHYKDSQIRALLFATSRTTRRPEQAPSIHGKQILSYIWKCLRPDKPRPTCSTTYDYELWGEPSLISIVRYFKNSKLTNYGSIQDLENHFLL